MKSVMLSIQSKWVEKIASGKKTIEVRKSRPKLETPFKCYIYETMTKLISFHFDWRNLTQWQKTIINGRGKVIGEFVCDRIDEIKPIYEFYREIGYDLDDNQIKETCLTREELKEYGKIKTLYGWHISDLKIYDKPKELSEFYQECKGTCVDTAKKILCLKTKTLKTFGCDRKIPLKRPPQSWCYVESLGE